MFALQRCAGVGLCVAEMFWYRFVCLCVAEMCNCRFVCSCADVQVLVCVYV